MLLVLILGLLMNAVALPLAGRRVWFLYRVISSGQPAPDRLKGVTGRMGAAIKRQVVEVFGQKKLLKWSVPGAAHFFVFWAFLILATVYLEAYGSLVKLLLSGGDGPMDWAIPLVGHWALLGFAQDFIAMMAFFGILTFVWIRLRNAPKEYGRRSRFFGSHLSGAWITLFMIFNVIWTMFLFRAASAALGNLPYQNGAFVSIGVGKLLDGLGHGALEALEGIGLLLHIGVMLVFLIFVLNSKHLHIFVAPLNVLFGRDPVALGAAKPMMSGGKALTLEDLEDLDEDAKLGVGAAEDFSWKGILDFTTCTECGRCQDQCPAWNTEKPLSPKLMIMALRDHTLAKAPYLLADEDKRESLLEGNEKLAKEVERPLVGDTGDDWFYMPESGAGVIDPDVLWSCVTCGACVNQCPVDIEHVDHIVDMRRYQVLVESNFPSELNGLFKGMENKGNPWNMSPTVRMDWAKDLPFDVKVVGGEGPNDPESLDEVEWLFWVGCAGAYEDRAKKTTRAVAELLDMAGVSFAVLGNGETCTGDSARRAGNEFVFQGLAAQNIETFKEYKVKKVVSTCAHCFNTLKNEYSQLGIRLEVVHHTQLLNRLVREKKLTPIRTPERSWSGPHERPITYHDPCYLGRHNQVYEAPRELLDVLPDTRFVEMPRNSERSFCCGAGGARMWMEETIGTRINETRTKEAVATGAEQIAVGCPFCRVMLSDGLTAAQSKGEAREEVEVLDIAQMLLSAVKGESAKPGKLVAASSEAKAGAGNTATATIEREDEATSEATPETTPETTRAEPDAEDVGAAAKAGGGSLFDLGDDSADAKAEPAEKPAGDDLGGGSLFDLSSAAEAEPEPAAKQEAEPEAKEKSAAPSPKTELPKGGSLFDIEAPAEVPQEAPAKTEPEARSQPAPSCATATPASTIPAGGSLFDIEAPAEEPAPAEPEAKEAGPKPEAAPSGTTVTPASTIPEGGSLFDIQAPAEEPAPTEPEAKQAEPEATEAEPEAKEAEPEAKEAEPEAKPAPPASSTTATPASTIPAGGSLFDIQAPAEEPTPAASDDSTPADEDKAPEGADAEVAAESEEDADDDAETEKPKTAPSSGEAHQPRTDAEIGEGGSLFDL